MWHGRNKHQRWGDFIIRKCKAGWFTGSGRNSFLRYFWTKHSHCHIANSLTKTDIVLDDSDVSDQLRRTSNRHTPSLGGLKLWAKTGSVNSTIQLAQAPIRMFLDQRHVRTKESEFRKKNNKQILKAKTLKKQNLMIGFANSLPHPISVCQHAKPVRSNHHHHHNQFNVGFSTRGRMLAHILNTVHGLKGSPTTVRVLLQSFMPGALPDTNSVSQRKTSFWRGLAFGAAPARKAARANDCLFDSTMTAYIAASLHYLEAVPPIRHLEDWYSSQHQQNCDIRSNLHALSDQIAQLRPIRERRCDLVLHWDFTAAKKTVANGVYGDIHGN